MSVGGGIQPQIVTVLTPATERLLLRILVEHHAKANQLLITFLKGLDPGRSRPTKCSARPKRPFVWLSLPSQDPSAFLDRS